MKKFLAGLMAATTITTFSVTAMASSITVQPRSLICSVCNEGYLYVYEEPGDWSRTYRRCTHGFKKGHDEIDVCDVYKVYECMGCGDRSRVFIAEVKEPPRCRGYN